MAAEGLKKTGVALTAEGAAKFKDDVQGASDSLAKFAQGASKGSESINALGEIATGALRRLGELAVDGFGMLLGKLGQFATGAMETEKQLASINAVLVSTEGQSGMTMDSINALSMEFRDLAEGSDDAVRAIEKIGITSGAISAEKMPQFIEASANLGVLLGSNEAAATLLARANEDVTGAMGRAVRSGVLFSDSLKQQIKDLDAAGQSSEALELFMARVSEATAGQAAAAADTLSGRLKILQNHLVDIGEDATIKFLPAMQSIVEGIQGPLEAAAENAAAWGSNIVIEFANGIIAAAGAVISALTDIGNLVSYWLSPGSPPRLLPNIDQWGTAAMDEFVGGFGLADFGVLDSVGGAIEKSLRSASALSGNKTDAGLVPAIIGSRSAVAEAIAQLGKVGAVSDATFSKIFSAVGAATPDLQQFVRLSFALEQSNRAVATAQADVNRVTQQYDAILSKAAAEVSGITNAQQDLMDAQRISQLELVAGDPNATLAEKEMARLEIQRLGATKQQRNLETEKQAAVTLAQAKLDKELEHQSALKEQVDVQQQLLGFQEQQNKLLGEQFAMLQKIADAAGGGGGGGGGAGARPAGGGGLKPLGGVGVGGGMGIPSGDEIAAKLFSPIDAAMANIQGKLGELGAAWAGAWAGISGVMQPAREKLDQVGAAFGNLIAAFQKSAPEAQVIIADMVRFITVELGISLPSVFETLRSLLDNAAIWWDKWGSDVMQVVNFAFRVVVATLNVALLLISGGIQLFIAAMNKDWQGFWGIMVDTAQRVMDSILAVVGQKLDDFKSNWSTVLEQIGTIVLTLLGQAADNAYSMASEFVTLGAALVQGIADGITGAIGEVVKAAMAVAEAIPAPIRKFLGIASPSKLGLEIGSNFTRSIGQGSEDEVSGLLRSMGGVIRSVMPPSSSQSASYTNNQTYAPQFQYAPTYVGQAGPVSDNFGVMQAMFG